MKKYSHDDSVLKDENMALMFSFLPPIDLLNIALVCRKWYYLSKNNHILWKPATEELLSQVTNQKRKSKM